MQNITGMHYTDDVIHCLAVNGNAGKSFLGDDLQYLLRGGFLIDGDHIDARGKDILHGGIIELQSGLYQLFFLLLKHALLFDGIQHIHQFLLSDGGLLFAIVLLLKRLHQSQEQKLNGVKMTIRIRSTPANAIEMLSAFILAKLLGIISPKVRTTRVEIPVAIATA